MQNNIKTFERNASLEYEIDRKLVTHYLSGDTVTMFLNILTEYVDKYNNEGGNYTFNSLRRFLKFRSRFRDYESDYRSPFSTIEVEYIKKINEYIDYVRSLFYSPSLNIVDIINGLIYKVEDEYSRKNDFHSIREFLINELERFKYIKFRLEEKENYFELYIHNNRTRICIINDASAVTHIKQDVAIYALVVLCDASQVFSALKCTPRISLIRCMDEKGFFYTIETCCLIDRFEMEVRKLLMEESARLSDEGKATLEKLTHDMRKLQTELNITYRALREEHLHDLGVIRIKLRSALDYFENITIIPNSKITLKLAELIRILKVMMRRIKDNHNIRESILFSLSEIKRNNTLYILSKGNAKNYDSTYGEENLTSIVASNLRCLYKHNRDISVHCEAIVGNGRSDIKIEMAGREICLVEAKLIKVNSNVEDETRKAVDQLFARYSENNGLIGGDNIELYLVLFSHDKNFRDLAKKIQNALHVYADRNDIEYKEVNQSECGFDFVYTEKRSSVLDKERRISVMVCNMEVEHKKNSAKRTANKNYNV